MGPAHVGFPKPLWTYVKSYLHCLKNCPSYDTKAMRKSSIFVRFESSSPWLGRRHLSPAALWLWRRHLSPAAPWLWRRHLSPAAPWLWRRHAGPAALGPPPWTRHPFRSNLLLPQKPMNYSGMMMMMWCHQAHHPQERQNWSSRWVHLLGIRNLMTFNVTSLICWLNIVFS